MKLTGTLGVDAGMMSLVPASLVKRGKYSDLDKAIAEVEANGGAAVGGEIGIAFKLAHATKVYVGIKTEDDGWDLAVRSLCISDRKTLAYTVISVVILPGGVFVLADPCYVLDDESRTDYKKLCYAMMPCVGQVWEHPSFAYNKAVVISLNDLPVIACESGYGDGGYPVTLRLENTWFRLEIEFIPDEDEDDDDN